MAATVRRFDVARQAAVRVCDRQGEHHGNGLLLDLDSEGVFVLTCHHVVARLSPENLFIATRRADGSASEPVPAQYDAARSRPGRDAVVLRVENLSIPSRPFLHALNPGVYSGMLPSRATGLSFWQTDTFDARIAACTRLEVEAGKAGTWPDAPRAYELPFVFRLADATDARPGISGSPIVYEDGVLGLAHFSRGAGSDFQREVYLVPLSTWADGWPALSALIEPLFDSRLRATAIVKRAASLQAETDLIMARFRPDIYIAPAALAQAQAALARFRAVVIVGRPKSGKTRLVWQLLQEHPDALVVIPRRSQPPESFETSSFAGREAILFFDDLQQGGHTWNLQEWRTRIEEAGAESCAIVCACRDGGDWTSARDASGAALLGTLDRDSFVFTSKTEEGGRDLTEAEGSTLAEALGMSAGEFSRRFDGTPGSLTLDLSEMRKRYQRLRGQDWNGVRISRVLDSAKLLYEASQSQLRISILRAVAESIRGDGPLSTETWDTLLLRTCEEGFGQIDEAAEQLQIYKPYLEECVEYRPKGAEFEKLIDILNQAGDYDGLENVARAFYMRYANYPAAERAARASIAGGNRHVAVMLGWILSSQPERAPETEQAYKERLAAGEDSWVNFGNFLLRQPGRKADAEAAFREAIRIGGAGEADLAHWSLANLLAGQPNREAEREASYRVAAEHGLFMAQCDLARMLGASVGREPDAEEAARQAIATLTSQREAEVHKADSFEKNPAAPRDDFYRDFLRQAYFILGSVLERDPTRLEEAVTAYRQAEELGSGDAAVNLGRIYAMRPGREQEAEAMFQKGIAAGVEQAYYNLAYLLAQQPAKLGEAESVLRDAIRAGHGGAHRRLGSLLEPQQGRESEAEEEFKAAIKAGDREAWAYLGYLLHRCPGRESETESVYLSGIEAGLTNLYLPLASLLRGQAGRQADYEKALRQAAAHGSGEARLHLGVIYRDQERYQDAEPEFRAAFEAGVEEAQTYLGVTLVLLGRIVEGTEHLRAAKAAGSEFAEQMLAILEKDEAGEADESGGGSEG